MRDYETCRLSAPKNFANILFHLSRQVGIKCVKFSRRSKESKTQESSSRFSSLMSDHDLYNLLASSSSHAFLNSFHKVLLHSVHLSDSQYSCNVFGELSFCNIKECLKYSVSIKISIFVSVSKQDIGYFIIQRIRPAAKSPFLS